MERVRGIRDTEDKFMLFILLMGAMFVLLAIAFELHRSDCIREMNAKELHYDANDWFILINKSEGLIGIYDGTEPIQHIWVNETKISEGTFPVLIYSEDE